MTFQIITVLPDELIGDEPLGSKRKFWFRRDDQDWLFKEARPDTGEDWAEKIAAEMARAMNISAASVELAVFEGRRGCACKSFVPANKLVSLIHGNEILAAQIAGYDRAKKLHQCDHTLENIIQSARLMFGPEIQNRVLTKLAGYLVLDALIGNTDRHHENWGLLWQETPTPDGRHIKFAVAPSFDHASSLGRELLDERRTRWMDRVDGIQRYARGGVGGVYLLTTDLKGANPLALVEFAVNKYGPYFQPALNRLALTPIDTLFAAVEQVPQDRMSSLAKRFSCDLIKFNYDTLTGLRS